MVGLTTLFDKVGAPRGSLGVGVPLRTCATTSAVTVVATQPWRKLPARLVSLPLRVPFFGVEVEAGQLSLHLLLLP
jgi:hypothetical protein